MSAILPESLAGFDWTADLTPIRSINPTCELARVPRKASSNDHALALPTASLSWVSQTLLGLARHQLEALGSRRRALSRLSVRTATIDFQSAAS
jgi:hypothetical protein